MITGEPEPTRVDPFGCGCTDCIVGWSVPLEDASDEQVLGMLFGDLTNATGLARESFDVSVQLKPRAERVYRS